jgi:A/G-specific adenine glycosylase
MQATIAKNLLQWYQNAARRLPWRGVSDSYLVWVSEIMLQQTRVETVIPYYERWIQRFPTLQSLADADEQEVLSVWEGLGYYSRARNMQRAARQVVRQFGGQLPADRRLLEKLPGIGRYTAGAIASIAFGLDEAALDGNIRRVYARLFDLDIPVQSKEGVDKLWSIAAEQLPYGQAGDYNQALMDLGAMICLPRAPRCEICPLNAQCLANSRGTQALRPVLAEKKQTPHWKVTAAVIWQKGKVLLAQRPANGLLGGLWEFPGGKVEQGESFEAGLKREICEELAAEIEVGEPFGVYRHAYTHFKVTLHAFTCRLRDGETPQPIEASQLVWAEIAELENYPMGKIDRQIARRIVDEQSAPRLL